MEFPLEVEMTIGMWLELVLACVAFASFANPIIATCFAISFVFVTLVVGKEGLTMNRVQMMIFASWIVGIFLTLVAYVLMAVEVSKYGCYQEYGTYDECMSEQGQYHSYDCQYCPQEPLD